MKSALKERWARDLFQKRGRGGQSFPLVVSTSSEGSSLGHRVHSKMLLFRILLKNVILTGWRYDGMLCEAKDLQCGAMWECPILLELNQVPLRPSSQSKEALDELSKSFHNLAAFREPANGDSAKSASVVAANDPRDASEVGRFLSETAFGISHLFLGSNIRI